MRHLLNRNASPYTKLCQLHQNWQVDGIMIHSKEKSPDEVLSFLEAYNKFEKRVPVVVVPTSYNSITEDELQRAGASICIKYFLLWV